MNLFRAHQFIICFPPQYQYTERGNTTAIVVLASDFFLLLENGDVLFVFFPQVRARV